MKLIDHIVEAFLWLTLGIVIGLFFWSIVNH